MTMPNVAPGAGAPAGFLLRLVATIIDSLILAVPTWILIALLAGAVGLTLGTAIAYVAFVVAGILYWGKLESGPSQATLGKKVMKIKVVSATGGSLDFAGAAKRSIVHWIAGITAIFDVVLGFIAYQPLTSIAGLLVLVSCLAILFKANKQGFHDDFAGAQVVRA